MSDAPERIWVETEAYDFPGFAPCFVWHHPESLEDGTDGAVEYVRADAAGREHDALAAQVAALREALERIKANVEWAEEGREIAMVAGHVAQIAGAALATPAADHLAAALDAAHRAGQEQMQERARDRVNQHADVLSLRSDMTGLYAVEPMRELERAIGALEPEGRG